MAVLRRLLEVVVDVTARLDEEVERGYDLSKWGDLMKFLHALQIQVQALIDIVLRASALLGHPPATPLDAAAWLEKSEVIDAVDRDFFRRVLGFRNVVVHEYASVDVRVVGKVLGSREYRKVLSLAEKICRRLFEEGVDP